jgi:hypothetical protein
MSLDMTDVLLDPDMGGHTFTVLRRSRVTGANGRATTLGERRQDGVVGSVQPASSEDLERLPEEERIAGAVMIYTPHPLSAGDGVWTADRVFWDSRHWIVRQVDAWPFGAGFVQALAVLEPLHNEPAQRA